MSTSSTVHVLNYMYHVIAECPAKGCGCRRTIKAVIVRPCDQHEAVDTPLYTVV